MNIYRYILRSLQSVNIIGEYEGLRSYIKRSQVEELQNDIDKYIAYQESRIKNFVIASYLFNLSEVFYWLIKHSESPEVRFKSKMLRKYIDEKVIGYYSVQVMQFFKWDIDRRVWKQNNKEYKISYLRNALDEVKDELEGRSDSFIQKYLLRLIDLVEFHFIRALTNTEVIEKVKEYGIFQKQNPYDIFEMLTEFKNAIQSDIEESDLRVLLKPYKMLAKNYLEGLVKTEEKYNNLFLSFIKAQDDYKEYLENAISALNNVDEPLYERLRVLLNENKFDEFIIVFKSVFSSVPNEVIKNTTEAYYHVFIHIVLKIIGVSIESEISTNLGRIDSVIFTDTHINIIEFKMEDNNSPLDQIRERKYYEKYLSDSREINILGIVFSKKERNIKEYAIEGNIKKTYNFC